MQFDFIDRQKTSFHNWVNADPNRAAAYARMGKYGRTMGNIGKLAIGMEIPMGGYAPSTPVRNMFNKQVLQKAGVASTIGKGLMGIAGPALGAAFILSSFKNEGAWGGIKTVGENAAIGLAFQMGGGLVGGGILAATAYAGYQLAKNSPYIARRMAAGRMSVRGLTAEYTSKFRREQGELDLTNNLVDNFGTVATMRQRSIQAIQGSKLNGRVALGQEASLVHKGWY